MDSTARSTVGRTGRTELRLLDRALQRKSLTPSNWRREEGQGIKPVLTTDEVLKGGDIAYCRDPNLKPKRYDASTKTTPLQGVRAATEIHYWGHYPVADLEFETDAPVSVGLRAWSPFIPGDTPASNIPSAIFEVHLRNTSAAAQKGTIAFNFPGPDTQEALSSEFTRQDVNEDFRGVFVASQGGVNYVLGVLGADSTPVQA